MAGILDGNMRPALDRVAVVPSKEPSELVAFVTRRAGIVPEEVTEQALRVHCKDRLNPAYVPKFIRIEDALPQLPNGKTNLTALRELATEIVKEEGEEVMDSLGQMKKLSKWAIWENQVIHRCYAYWMVGVLFDHYFRCALDTEKNGTDLIPYCVILCQKGVKPWTEVLIRSFGNDQDLFGFILLGSYQDSRPDKEGGSPKVKLGMKDLYLFAVYLALALPFAQIFKFITFGFAWPSYWGSCDAATEWCQDGRVVAPESIWNWDYMQMNYYNSDHRWYLIMVLEARIFLQICEILRMPGWLQGIIISIPCFLPSSVFGGDTAAKNAFDICENADTQQYVQYTFSWIFRNFGPAGTTTGTTACPMYQGWIQWYTACYVWCFHYLRSLSRIAGPHLPKGPVWSAAALGASMTIGVLMAMFHYPNNVLENGTGLEYAPLELGVDFFQPVLFVLGMTYLPLDLSWWGNTTLGAYAFHFYFKDGVSTWFLGIAPAMSWDPTGLLLFFICLAVCLTFTSILGPLGHWGVLALPNTLPGKLKRAKMRYARMQQARQVQATQRPNQVAVSLPCQQTT
jgi:hypothetical protein